MAWSFDRIDADNLRERTQWYAFIRMLFLLAIAVPGIVSLYVFEGWSTGVRTDLSIIILAISSNLLFYGLTKFSDRTSYHIFLGSIWIALDILLITTFIFVNGGIESRSPILYGIPILISAALFGRKGIYISAMACALLYIGLITADYFDVIRSIGAFDPTLRSNLAYVVNTVCFFPAVLFVFALAIDFITSLLLQKQEEARESVAALETAQEIAKLGSWEWDIARDEITWSKELYRIYGVKESSHKLSYSNYLKLLRPDEVSSHRKIVLNAMKKKISFNVDHEIETPDGTVKYIHGEGRPVRNKDGKVVKMSGTSQDVTDIYHLDMAKREFVSLASHQLRTPASGVKAFLSLLIDNHGGKLTTAQRNFVKQAYEANDRQLEIIDSLLSLASIESGKLTLHKEPVEVHDTIKRCVPGHTAHLKSKKQKMHFKPTKRLMYVDIDAGAVQMAVDNLISNAIKYTHERGIITISTRLGKRSVYIDIDDTGIGIARKDLALLFQKFSRISDPANKTVGGSGLGLYMAKYIIELHGGSIFVRSRHGVGTRFTIKLPLSKTYKVK